MFFLWKSMPVLDASLKAELVFLTYKFYFSLTTIPQVLVMDAID